MYGTIKIIGGDELLNTLKKLVNKYEKNSKKPVSVEKMSERTLKQINGIVGFKIHITDIQAAYKLSQTRKNSDYNTIINELETTKNTSSLEIAKEMKKRRL